jgi:hypothetical protein
MYLKNKIYFILFSILPSSYFLKDFKKKLYKYLKKYIFLILNFFPIKIINKMS